MKRLNHGPGGVDAGCDANNAARNADTVADLVAANSSWLGYRGTTLETVLDYMSEVAGFFVHVKPNVNIMSRVDAWTGQPVSKEAALKLLQNILKEKGCTAIQDGRVLTIIRSQDVKKSRIPLPNPRANFVAADVQQN